jgi:hypothetical protein
MPILGIIASSFRSAAGPDGAYDALATANPTSGSSVVFAGIPSGYKHLQIRISAVLDNAGQTVYTRFNGDSFGMYRTHNLSGDGSSASAGGGPTSAIYAAVGATQGSVTTYPNLGIVDILDYSNTNKYKTQRVLSGADNNSTGGSIEMYSGVWLSTNTITSIEVYTGSTYATGTTISLYGVK